MIIKTLRDAELALNNLQRELDALARRATNTSGVTLEEVRSIVRQSQQVRTTIVRETGSQFNITDIDSTPSEGQIIHRLIHLFYEESRFAKDVRLNNGWYDTDDGLRRWQTDIGTANPIGGASPNYQIRWLDSVTPALNYGFFIDPSIGVCLNANVIPLINNVGELGNTSLRWKKLWAVDIDFSGTVTGTLPGVDTNSELNANCSALLTLTTTFADITGCSVSLNKNGKWLIIGNIDGTKTLNDDDIQGQLVYDGTAQTGLIRMGAASTVFLRSTGTRSWILSVTGQPKTAKLQAKKVLGTGTSYVDTNSNIVAIYLST